MATELTNMDLTVVDELQTSTDGNYTVHGSGTFDDLMEAVNKHLDAQFRLGRIQGQDYAGVYTQSLQSAMGSAVQYLLGRKDSDLIAAQIRKIDAEIVLVGQQGDLIEKQGLKVDAEISLLQAKERTEAKQLDVLDAQADMIAEQAKGFQWSANNKYLKTIIDGQAVNANIEGVGMVAHPFNQSNLTSVANATKPY